MSDESVGIIALFVLYTLGMCVFMFAAYSTYMKVTGWFTTNLIEDGKKNGWDFKRVILPLIARNIPAIIILGLLMEVDTFMTVICYLVSYFILKGLAGALKDKQKASQPTGS